MDASSGEGAGRSPVFGYAWEEVRFEYCPQRVSTAGPPLATRSVSGARPRSGSLAVEPRAEAARPHGTRAVVDLSRTRPSCARRNRVGARCGRSATSRLMAGSEASGASRRRRLPRRSPPAGWARATHARFHSHSDTLTLSLLPGPVLEDADRSHQAAGLRWSRQMPHVLEQRHEFSLTRRRSSAGSVTPS